MTATEKHFPPYIDSENTDADTQGNAESWVTPDRALRYTEGHPTRVSLFILNTNFTNYANYRKSKPIADY